MKQFTYLFKNDVIALNNKALRLRKNRAVHKDNYAELDWGIKYPVVHSFPTGHNDRDIRSQIFLGEDKGSIWVDIETKDFNKLPTVEIEDEAIADE